MQKGSSKQAKIGVKSLRQVGERRNYGGEPKAALFLYRSSSRHQSGCLRTQTDLTSRLSKQA